MSTQLRIDRSATAQVVRVSAAPLLTKIEVSGAIAGLVAASTKVMLLAPLCTGGQWLISSYLEATA
jgi:hypothetical protein